MTDSYSFETYLSPFTWRYGSDEMRAVWSLANKRRLWRRIWVALAEAQAEVGLVTAEQVEDLRKQQDNIDLARAHELEAELKHDLMAEVHTYAEQCPVGGGIIHLGATSMDIEDNADALRLRDGLDLIIDKLKALLSALVNRMEETAETVCMAYTHLQPAEPTTIGYRLAFYAQDLLTDYESLVQLQESIKGKGFKGAVGTSASYSQLLKETSTLPESFEASIMEKLNLKSYDISHQTYTRRQDWAILNGLAGIALTLNKFAFDLRILQSPPMGEWHEPFASKQIGSSAMPFKRNPIHAENMNSLARLVAGLPRVLWDDGATSLLERTLDDSANRRVVLPQAFLATDELLRRGTRLVKGMTFDELAIQRNIERYGIFAATERLLMDAVRAGGNRQELHEVIRQQSLTAWGAIREGRDNPLAELLVNEAQFLAVLSQEAIQESLNVEDYVGDAPIRTKRLVDKIRNIL